MNTTNQAITDKEVIPQNLPLGFKLSLCLFKLFERWQAKTNKWISALTFIFKTKTAWNVITVYAVFLVFILEIQFLTVSAIRHYELPINTWNYLITSQAPMKRILTEEGTFIQTLKVFIWD